MLTLSGDHCNGVSLSRPGLGIIDDVWRRSDEPARDPDVKTCPPSRMRSPAGRSVKLLPVFREMIKRSGRSGQLNASHSLLGDQLLPPKWSMRWSCAAAVPPGHCELLHATNRNSHVLSLIGFTSNMTRLPEIHKPRVRRL